MPIFDSVVRFHSHSLRLRSFLRLAVVYTSSCSLFSLSSHSLVRLLRLGWLLCCVCHHHHHHHHHRHLAATTITTSTPMTIAHCFTSSSPSPHHHLHFTAASILISFHFFLSPLALALAFPPSPTLLLFPLILLFSFSFTSIYSSFLSSPLCTFLLLSLSVFCHSFLHRFVLSLCLVCGSRRPYIDHGCGVDGWMDGDGMGWDGMTVVR